MTVERESDRREKAQYVTLFSTIRAHPDMKSKVARKL